MKKLVINILSVLLLILSIGSCKDNVVNDTPVELISFSVVDQWGTNHELNVNNLESTISNSEPLPAYVNLARLIPRFNINRAEAVLKIEGETQQSGRGQANLSGEAICDLYIGESKERSYVIRIMKEAMSNSFRAFGFADQVMAVFPLTIDEETSEIFNVIDIPINVSVEGLQPIFELNEPRAIVRVNGVTQQSGVQRHDFSKPVVYTVEGEDGSSRTYIVSLKLGNHAAIENPVMRGSYADPTAIRVGNEIYVYVTGGRIRGYKSTDLVNWSRIGTVSEVFTTRPDFVEVVSGKDAPGMWAPDINYFDGKYVMYYAISQWGEGARCGIGVGVSNVPQGPFVPPAGNSNGKLFISTEIGVHNSIDPCFYEENGKRYLFWGSFHGIYMTELTADGMAVKDMNVKTKVAGNAFEATYVHKRGNYYYLFTSVGGCCNGINSSYKVLVGRSENLAGPYRNRAGVDLNNINSWGAPSFDPIVLQGNDTYIGPGHNARIITDKNGVDWMLYHSYIKENNAVGSRSLMLGKVNWDGDGWPIVDNGTPSPVLAEMPAF